MAQDVERTSGHPGVFIHPVLQRVHQSTPCFVRQVWALSVLFLVLAVGNTIQTSLVIRQKIKEDWKLKYRFTRLDKHVWTHKSRSRAVSLSAADAGDHGRTKGEAGGSGGAGRFGMGEDRNVAGWQLSQRNYQRSESIIWRSISIAAVPSLGLGIDAVRGVGPRRVGDALFRRRTATIASPRISAPAIPAAALLRLKWLTFHLIWQRTSSAAGTRPSLWPAPSPRRRPRRRPRRTTRPAAAPSVPRGWRAGPACPGAGARVQCASDPAVN